jgi:hypothetical protein
MTSKRRIVRYDKLSEFTGPMWCVIDRSTGAVITTDAVLVATSPDELWGLITSAKKAKERAEKNGMELFTETEV